MEKPKKTKPALPPTSKELAQRELELRLEIQNKEKAAKAEIQKIEETFALKIRDALRVSLEGVGKHVREKDTSITEARTLRDSALKKAELSRAETIRRAEGDYVKTTQEAKKTFEELRDRLETETAKKTLPFREEYEKTEAALKAERTAQVTALVDAAKEELTPLVKELREIEAGRTKKAAPVPAPPAAG